MGDHVRKMAGWLSAAKESGVVGAIGAPEDSGGYFLHLDDVVSAATSRYK